MLGKYCLLAGLAGASGFSTMPTYDPDVVLTAESQNCDGRYATLSRQPAPHRKRVPSLAFGSTKWHPQTLP